HTNACKTYDPMPARCLEHRVPFAIRAKVCREIRHKDRCPGVPQPQRVLAPGKACKARDKKQKRYADYQGPKAGREILEQRRNARMLATFPRRSRSRKAEGAFAQLPSFERLRRSSTQSRSWVET